jgi:hypothetical protein
MQVTLLQWINYYWIAQTVQWGSWERVIWWKKWSSKISQIRRKCWKTAESGTFKQTKFRQWNIVWFNSEILLAVYINKICLKGTNISGHWRHPNKCDDGMKAITQFEFQKMLLTVTASLSWVHGFSKGVLRRWPLSVSCKCTGMRRKIKSFRELHSHTP